jgi:hypothetical protein
MDSRTKLLLGILAFVGLFAVWTWIGPGGDDGGGDAAAPTRSGAAYDEEGNPTGRVLPGARRPTAAQPVEQVEELRVAALAIRPREYTPGRDPWRFVDPPPPPPPPPPPGPSAAELEARRRAEEEAARLRAQMLQQQQAEAAKPKPPPFTMSYLGNFGPPSRRIAVFSDGKTIYNAQQGEVLAGKFIVAEIGYESVDIRFVGFPDWPPQRLAVGPGGR